MNVEGFISLGILVASVATSFITIIREWGKIGYVSKSVSKLTPAPKPNVSSRNTGTQTSKWYVPFIIYGCLVGLPIPHLGWGWVWIIVGIGTCFSIGSPKGWWGIPILFASGWSFRLLLGLVIGGGSMSFEYLIPYQDANWQIQDVTSGQMATKVVSISKPTDTPVRLATRIIVPTPTPVRSTIRVIVPTHTPSCYQTHDGCLSDTIIRASIANAGNRQADTLSIDDAVTAYNNAAPRIADCYQTRTGCLSEAYIRTLLYNAGNWQADTLSIDDAVTAYNNSVLKPTTDPFAPTKIVPTSNSRLYDLAAARERRATQLAPTKSCKRDEASVKSSTVNVRVGPGAGRTGEVVYRIQSYLKAGECVTPMQRTQDGGWVRITSAPRSEADGGWVAVELLSFGPEIGNVPRITIEPTRTLENQNAGLNLPVGIEHLGGANYVCYNIQGNNADELNRQMAEYGPKIDGDYEYLAMASYRYEFNGGQCYSDGRADLSNFTVSTVYSITMPCWRPSSGTSSDLIASFDGLMRYIAAHELRHVEIARKYGSILQQRLKASNTCDVETGNAIIDQVLAEDKSAQEAFHASPEGQPRDWP
jgi:predicted secreted Zn-dependent protease